MQKCIFIAALLGLSIATYGPTTASTLNNRNNSPSEVTRPDARVGNANALTQETRRVRPSRSVVTRTKYRAVVSWYRHGTVTANGERYNPNDLTVAHRTLPFNTWVRFTNPETGAEVIARVNDRGPYVRGREFDLSMGTARRLGILERGVATLDIEIIQENR